MQSLLLLDADVIIDLHELGIWESLIKKYNVYVASTVINVEALYFEDKKTKGDADINLREYVNNGLIHEVSATAEEQKRVNDFLKDNELHYIAPDPGELEAIAIINERKIEDLIFCTRDVLAQKIMIHMDFADQLTALETVLKKQGFMRKDKKVAEDWSEKRIKDLRRKIMLDIL